MRPLRRIFSISAVDLQTIAILAAVAGVGLYGLKNLLGHLIDWQAAIDRDQPPFLLVVLRYRPGLLLVGKQPFANHLVANIITGNQLGTVDVTKFIDARWLEMDVVNATTEGTRSAPGEPKPQFIIVDINTDHKWQALLRSRVFKELVLKEGIEPTRLGRGSRKPIENEAALAIGSPEALRHDVIQQFIGHQFSSPHELAGQLTECGGILHVATEQIAG